MYKIIKVSQNLEESMNVQNDSIELLKESFETVESAKEYVTTTLLEQNKKEWEALYSESDNIETTIDVDIWDNNQIIIENLYEGEPSWFEKYIIVEA